jgi:predicted cupin superfamily sugar epimerase
LDDPDSVIRRLKLAPHPEGGHFRETFRDTGSVAGRAHSTAIYYLLRAGERSRWHRIDAAEIWHWYGGAPLRLQISANGVIEDHILGSDLAKGQMPQIVVSAKAWQNAQSLGRYTLAGCTVAPGFLFDHFELAPGDKLPDAE